MTLDIVKQVYTTVTNMTKGKSFKFFTVEGKEVDVDISIFQTKEDGTLYTYYNTDGTPNLAKEQELIDAKDLEDAKNIGEVYTLNTKDYLISFQKDDADGMLQVKAGFELGLISTVIHFMNGTKMPIAAEDFPAFALWFVEKRNAFFV